MQEPYKKGIANRLDPESCAGDREVAGEALTGVHTGQPLSSEIILLTAAQRWLSFIDLQSGLRKEGLDQMRLLS